MVQSRLECPRFVVACGLLVALVGMQQLLGCLFVMVAHVFHIRCFNEFVFVHHVASFLND